MHVFLLALCITGQIACVTYLFRNGKVGKERVRVIDAISELAKEDIREGREFKWRYDEFNSISYLYMLLIFFKPVDSFYKNMDCMKPGPKKENI
jgi:hypothetical protein